MGNKTIDSNKYASIGLHPKDHDSLTDEDVKALDARLAMTPEERQKSLADAFDAAIARNDAKDTAG
jgi:hypothetical protein